MSVQYFDHGGVSNDRRLRRRNYHKSGVLSENRRERCENVKEVEQYISRIDETIGRKEKILNE